MVSSLLKDLEKESAQKPKSTSNDVPTNADNAKLKNIFNQEVSPVEQAKAEKREQIKQNLKPTKDGQILSSTPTSNPQSATSQSSTTANLFTTAQSSNSNSDGSGSNDQNNRKSNNSTITKSNIQSSSNSNSTPSSIAQNSQFQSQSQTSSITASSNSDLAMNSKAQSNVVKMNKQPADLQDFSSPNLFVKRARKQHQKFLQGIVNAFQSQTLNKTPVILSLVRQDTIAFENLCWGMNKVIDDNQKRNTELETNTERMQKKAQAGEKTLHFFEEEGIFANLLDDAKVITRVVRSPDFQAFAKKLPNNELHVPNKLEQAGEQAKSKIQVQEKQNDKKNQKGN